MFDCCHNDGNADGIGNENAVKVDKLSQSVAYAVKARIFRPISIPRNGKIVFYSLFRSAFIGIELPSNTIKQF